VAAAPALEAHLAGRLAPESDVLIVDEGPGATGESFAAVAAWLRQLGVADRRMVLFPSRTWGMPLAPAERQTWFAAARKYAPAATDERPARIAAQLGLDSLEDLSAGRWRAVVPGAAEEPAGAGHERRKYRGRDGSGLAYAIRYAGLGSWGGATVGRAAALAGAGVGPEVVAYTNGFLACAWIDGRPARRDAGGDPAFLAALQAYLCARARLPGTATTVQTGPIVEMLLENAAETLGANPPGLAAAARRLERLPAREAVIPDARLQPREWVRTPAGYVKVDAIDHGDGLRLPGPTDGAWDLAGAAVEFDLDDAAAADLVRRTAAAGGGSLPELADAVAAYRAPYVAFCAGEAALAAWEAPSPEDRRRLDAEMSRYRSALARELSRGDISRR
jgi:hypothetical protein